jgi:hypothetical protein
MLSTRLTDKFSDSNQECNKCANINAAWLKCCHCSALACETCADDFYYQCFACKGDMCDNCSFFCHSCDDVVTQCWCMNCTNDVDSCEVCENKMCSECNNHRHYCQGCDKKGCPNCVFDDGVFVFSDSEGTREVFTCKPCLLGETMRVRVEIVTIQLKLAGCTHSSMGDDDHCRLLLDLPLDLPTVETLVNKLPVRSASRPAAESSYQSHLKWEEIGSEKPKSGIEIMNDGLAAALQLKTELTGQEWDNLKGSCMVSYHTYIKVGEKYMKPAGKWESLEYFASHHIEVSLTVCAR